MPPFTRRIALVAALASVGALASASGASATVAPPAVLQNTLTVTADNDNDTITLGVTGGFITVNGAATTEPAGPNARIIVSGGGGNDTIDESGLAAANYLESTVSGDDGNDLITGGQGPDLLQGVNGEDRLVGLGGGDLMFGGEDNDVIVWNNKDASDTDIGGPGVDEVEVNGSATGGDGFVIRPVDIEGPGVELERVSLVQFTVDLEAERLTVNGLGGEDSFHPDPGSTAGITNVTVNGGDATDVLIGTDGADQLNGGPGRDSLFGTGGNDQITGGDGNDSLEGEGGEDRLVGGPGADETFADEGDDTIVWNNGDGTDPHNEGGAGFDRVEVNGSPVAGDAFQLEADSTGAKFLRTNLVPFALVLDRSVEAVAVNGGAGDDTLGVVQQGGRVQVAADGGSGNDTLNGAEESDSFLGGSGNDTLSGGAGSDLLDGAEGEDRLVARDHVGDLVRGGAGSDAAITDETTVDAVDGVEALDATPQPQGRDAVALAPRVGKVRIARPGGKLTALVRVTCPAAEVNGCQAVVSLETAKPVYLGALRAILGLGSKSVALKAGQTKTVPVRLNGAAASVATHGRLAARVRVESTDAAGNDAARSAIVGLRIPRH